MFLRQKFRVKDGKRHAYWALVESYRTERGPRQRVVSWLGKLDEQGRLDARQVANATDQQPNGCVQLSLLDQQPPQWVKVNPVVA